jgi:hypothetical protein
VLSWGRSLPSPAWTLVTPLLQAHLTWARDEHEGRGTYTSLTLDSGHLATPPFALAHALDPSRLGHAAHSLVGLGTPCLETPTGDNVACWCFGGNCRVLTGRFLKRYLAREYPISTALLAASAFHALVLAFLLPNPLCNSALAPSASRIEMAPKRKASSSSAAVIPPIDPNSQLPFAGNHMSIVSEPDLLHLVSIGVLPPEST